MWVQAVEQAQSTEVDAVRQSLYNQKLLSLSGHNISLNTNHHLSKPVMIGEISANGAINAIWETPPVKAQPWSPELNLEKPTCDWSYPWVCGKCETPRFA